MSGLSVFEQAMLDGLMRDHQGLIEAGDQFVDIYLSYFEYAFKQCPHVIREPAVRLLREEAGRRASEETRKTILAMADWIESAEIETKKPPPAPPIPPPPPPPRPALHFSSMKPGEQYLVLQTFTDFDGQLIEAGRTLTFKEYNFFPYDGGYTVFFEETIVRLAEISTANDEVLNALDSYLRRTAH